jgi:hypothetical protein
VAIRLLTAITLAAMDCFDPARHVFSADWSCHLVPTSTVAAGLKFYFQRTPSYFTASDTTKEPGVSPLLHRGFVIASAFDAAMSEGLSNLQALSVERELETRKVEEFFNTRNNDDLPKQILPSITSFV